MDEDDDSLKACWNVIDPRKEVKYGQRRLSLSEAMDAIVQLAIEEDKANVNLVFEYGSIDANTKLDLAVIDSGRAHIFPRVVGAATKEEAASSMLGNIMEKLRLREVSLEKEVAERKANLLVSEKALQTLMGRLERMAYLGDPAQLELDLGEPPEPSKDS